MLPAPQGPATPALAPAGRPRATRTGLGGGGAGPGAQFSGKECRARRGRPWPPRPCKPRCPPRASFIAALKPGSFRQQRCSPRPRNDSPAPPAADSRPLPDAAIRPSPVLAQSWGVSKWGCARAPRRPAPRRALPAPFRPPRPPALSLPPSPSITQKLVRLVPDSWRRAPLQERKKRRMKKGEKPARGSERERERPAEPNCAPRPAPPNPNGEPPHPRGQRARAQCRSIIYGRINYLAAPGRVGAGP